MLFVKDFFNAKLADLKKNIEEVQKSANQESKSSMGDKYETGRAMAQNEVFMLQSQKENFLRDIAVLDSIDFGVESKTVISGSLVETQNGWFLLSAGLGKVTFKERTIYCISLDSPLGLALFGKAQNETAMVNGRAIKILQIV